MKGFYDQHFALLARGQDPAHLRRVRDFIARVLGLRPGQRVLDQGCGIGQISRVLADAGCETIGVDQIPEYIAEARQQAVGLPAEFVCADAGEFVCQPPADAVISWHTSFGHAAQDSDNLRLLQAAWCSLKPGGSLLLDFPNFYHTLMHFQASFEQRFVTPEGEVRVVRHSRIEPAAGLLHQEWEFFYPGGEHGGESARRQGSLRIYLPDQLQQLLAQAGFEPVACYGNLQGESFALEHPRWICHARKRALA